MLDRASSKREFRRASGIPSFSALNSQQEHILEGERDAVEEIQQNLLHFQKLTDDVVREICLKIKRRF